MPKRRVVVTGIGLITPLGWNTQISWKNLISGANGVHRIAISPSLDNPLDTQTCKDLWNQYLKKSKNPLELDIGSPYAAMLPPASGEYDDSIMQADVVTFKSTSKFIRYALYAVELALRDADWKPTGCQLKERTGVAIGSGIGAIEETVASAWQTPKTKPFDKISPFYVPRILVNMASGYVSIKYGFQGPNHAASTACAAGAHSIGDAMRFIQHDDADVMIAGGSETAINPLTIAAFSKARALNTGKRHKSPDLASRPFDSDRDGFVLGEGAAILVLEELEHARKRNANIYAEICGYGLSGDAYHITAPSDDGKGAQLSMNRAIHDAKLEHKHISYVNAHATSTAIGDLAEAKAIGTVMKNGCLLSSTKGATGHLLGAAGAMEAAFTVLSVANDVVPITRNLESPPVDMPNHLDFVKTVARKHTVNYAISNSFGFGGTNSSLLFGKV